MKPTSTETGARSRLTAPLATVAYAVIAVAFTWPLARGLARDVPWDMGDPVLNIWILGWGADHLVRFLGGDLAALHGFWNANIFYPEPLTLAYSEHLIAQVVQILPVFAVTRNAVLCYNLLFLSTFVLAGLGMFLFVRDVTRNAAAGFVAGLVFAFMPMRVPQFSHVQVMSSQWMPFVLFGLRRYFADGRLRPLWGASLALVAQNLSCGYFLLYFAPFAGLYALWEVAARRRWRDASMWRHLVVAGVAVIGVTLPFLLPYLDLRSLGFQPRPLFEVETYSADVYSYLTSPAESWLWGRWLPVRVFPKAEGDLFPSFAALILAASGLAASVRRAWTASAGEGGAAGGGSWIARVAAAACLLYAVLAAVLVAGLGFQHIGPLPIKVTNLPRTLSIAAAAAVVLLLVSGRARAFAARWLGSAAACCAILGALAFLLSLGPHAKAWGASIWTGAPYEALYRFVPGYDGLRVPARLGVVVMVFVAGLAGVGADAIIRRRQGWGAGLALAAGAFVVVEAFAAPILVNGNGPEPGLATPPARLERGTGVPPEYAVVRTLPRDAVLAEFPFGRWAFELRYMYYSMEHWRPLINGYSGTFPPSYDERAAMLREPQQDPERSWATLVASGASHVILHEDAYESPDQAAAMSRWIAGHGGRVVTAVRGATVFALPR